MLTRLKNGQTACSLCRQPLATADESRRHRSDHMLRYWAQQPEWVWMYPELAALVAKAQGSEKA